jgi:hypothetical protein
MAKNYVSISLLVIYPYYQNIFKIKFADYLHVVFFVYSEFLDGNGFFLGNVGDSSVEAHFYISSSDAERKENDQENELPSFDFKYGPYNHPAMNIPSEEGSFTNERSEPRIPCRQV